MPSLYLDMNYYYKGSINCSLCMVKQEDEGFQLITNYGETIASIQTGYDLMEVLEDLHNDKYA